MWCMFHKLSLLKLEGTTDDEIKSYVFEYFRGLDESLFSEGMLCLNSKLVACVLSEGSYIEK